jgi:signal transduction histidine kinase
VALARLLRARLAARVALAGLAQFAVVAAGFAAVIEITRPRGGPPHEGVAGYVADHVAPALGDPVALAREEARLRDKLRAPAFVVDPDGRVIASSAPPGAARCGPEPRHGCHVAPLRFPDGRVGQVEVLAPGPPPPLGTRIAVIVLVVGGVSSWLLARSLTRPLRRLATAARALGEGDLSARVRLARDDELGEVARAFDDMAERIADLVRSEKELLANVSHELRTPLARIRVALDLAEEGDPETARESLRDIADDLDELERLIGDVLTAARLDLADKGAKGIPPLRRERVDVAALCEQAAARLRSAHPKRPLELALDEGLPPVDGDPVLLRRVVDNLLENAHKYTEAEDAPIVLSARPEAGVTIEVVDRGVGIAPADLPNVFRPFFRADRSRARRTGGLGLGLALAKRVIDAHDGAIALGPAPGGGTRATVTLPAARG